MIFFQELNQYKKSSLVTLLGEELLNLLLSESICKTKDENTFTFNFVGVIAYKKIILSILPKYSTVQNEKMKFENTIRLIKVFKKYGQANYQNLTSDFYPLNNQTEDGSILGLSDLFLRNFIYFGYYEREISEIIDGGQDDISWEDTISDITPYFVNKRPFYLDTKNIEYKSEESNIITVLHQNIIYDCYIRFSRLLGYEISNIIIPDAHLSTLGDRESLINIIKRELQVIYNDQQVKLLNAMIHYLEDEYVNYKKELSIFGTKRFEYVWEDVLKNVFNDQKNKLRTEISESGWKQYTATWENYDNDSFANSNEYQPDIVTVLGDSIMILDAKYYDIKLAEKGFKGNPGINDVAKQHIYEVIYSKLFKDYNIVNALLFPSDDIDNSYTIIGRVNLGLLSKLPIILYYIKVDRVFNDYINGNKFDEEILAEIISEIVTARRYKSIAEFD